MNPADATPSSVAAPAVERRGLSPVTAVIVAATLLGLALRLYQLSRPGYLLSVTEYDDGPYFGSAVRLLNGAIPYRDFVIVQPPGIVLLMLPTALLSKLAGTAWAMAASRTLTTLAGTSSILLVGRLIRHRGVVATILACGITAIFPDAIAAAHTVLVEPWLVLFCLLAVAAAFDGDQLTASARRLAWAGAAFGFAGAIEVWAIFPVIGLFILLRHPRKAAAFASGLTIGFGLPVLPFAFLALGRLYDDIVQAQLRTRPIRVPLAATHGPSRLTEMTGLTGLHANSTIQILISVLILAAIFGSLAAASIIGRDEPSALDWFTIAAFVTIAAAFLLPPQFYYHFTAFLAPFLAMTVALPIARLTDAIWPATTASLRPARLAAVLAGALIASMTTIQASNEMRLHANLPDSAVTAMRQLIPPGACLITDQVSFSIALDRFTSSKPGCPLTVDPLATSYAMTHGRDPRTGANRYPELVALWRDAFNDAQYIWISRWANRRIPWTRALKTYLRSTFTRILIDKVGILYKRASNTRPDRPDATPVRF